MLWPKLEFNGKKYSAKYNINTSYAIPYVNDATVPSYLTIIVH
jgi:hypothetical protein